MSKKIRKKQKVEKTIVGWFWLIFDGYLCKVLVFDWNEIIKINQLFSFSNNWIDRSTTLKSIYFDNLFHLESEIFEIDEWMS